MFIDNVDGTITDNQTGLIWLKNADCFGLLTWEEALHYSINFGGEDCGLGDGSRKGCWRIPSIKELLTLRDHGFMERDTPFINGGNDDVKSLCYWSVQKFTNDTISKVDMVNGAVGVDYVKLLNRVILVRS